ncbi:unconventional prefoldin RPB5 interactor-like protein isoform X2 [Hylaeus volcanicus]|uniref:unconventional prefoldin RPB5 interactor-like protein isoform X2 n=1 Tax=Hylaeus volcanicus TaxID=313075 RepID=UPI0023B85959|nr:unconventional prefoldin RPB5 interactor-like protein isoform X2 [Hylaeus volcanicus]
MENVDELRNLQHTLLEDVFLKGIQRNEEQCKVWTAYKNGHLKVAEALGSLQKEVYVNCMVPIGKRALMKGKLIHTNEVLACLGDGYFAKYSASGAQALCERRIQRAEEMLKDLSGERDLYETRMMIAETDLFTECAGKEIVEHWNEDQVEEWKKKHREREKEYNQKLAKLRQEEKRKIDTEEDLFHRLDQLELEEELADEYDRWEDERRELFGDDLEEDEDEDEEEEEEECSTESKSSSENEKEDPKEKETSVSDSENKQSKESIEHCRLKKSVSFADQEDLLNKNEVETSAKKVNVESSEEDVLRIEFSHSQNNPVVKSDDDTIETPADIYRIFSKPKSILRRSPNDVAPVQVAPPEYSTEEEGENEESIKPSAYETVVKDIKERICENLPLVPDVASKADTETRPVSRFKKDRQSKK